MDEQQELMQSIWDEDTVYRPDLFAGKTVVVSGGGSGIGRATAILFARLGAQVVICGRTLEKLERVLQFLESKGCPVMAHAMNIREPEQVSNLFDAVQARFGTPHMLINNAGGQFPKPAIEFSPNGWNAVISNNLNGTWFMMQEAAKRWRDAGQAGSIVNVVAVTERGMPGVAHTVAARSGVIGVTRTVAIEWAPLQIRVNCIAPGLTASEGLSVYPPEAVKEFPLANPMKRPGTVMEIAQGCVFLAGPSGSFMTGEVLTLDGGGKLWGELWTAGRPDYYKVSTEASQ